MSKTRDPQDEPTNSMGIDKIINKNQELHFGGSDKLFLFPTEWQLDGTVRKAEEVFERRALGLLEQLSFSVEADGSGLP